MDLPCLLILFLNKTGNKGFNCKWGSRRYCWKVEKKIQNCLLEEQKSEWMREEVRNFSYAGSDCKYVKSAPSRLCHNFSTLPYSKSRPTQYINKWVWLCSNITLFVKQTLGWLWLLGQCATLGNHYGTIWD